jgi:hypothetical protein
MAQTGFAGFPDCDNDHGGGIVHILGVVTSIVFSAANGLRPLLIAAAAFFRLVLCR